MELGLWVVVGFLAGILLWRLLAQPIADWLLRRWVRKAQPPKGTRPEIEITYDGVTYDLTDSLIRVADNEDGWAKWVIVGPPHLRLLRTVKPKAAITSPPPRETEVAVCVAAIDDDWCRFMTMEEIVEMHPKPWPET